MLIKPLIFRLSKTGTTKSTSLFANVVGVPVAEVIINPEQLHGTPVVVVVVEVVLVVVVVLVVLVDVVEVVLDVVVLVVVVVVVVVVVLDVEIFSISSSLN